MPEAFFSASVGPPSWDLMNTVPAKTLAIRSAASISAATMYSSTCSRSSYLQIIQACSRRGQDRDVVRVGVIDA